MSRSNLNTALLLVIAVSAGSLTSRILMNGGMGLSGSGTETVSNWEQYQEPSSDLTRGDGTITVIAFSDFQCPYCALVQGTMSALVEKYPGQVSVRYRHFPLAYHPHAVAAAEAAECASEQGAFVKYHDLLFAQQDSIGVKAWEHFAAESGVQEIPAFEECVRSRRYSDRVEEDLAIAMELGLTGTPSFLVNGSIVRGAVPLAAFEEYIK